MVIEKIVRRMHDEEEGAVLIAGLAAAMMLIIVVLTAYDAGGVARDRVLVQTAADSAAYSHAAVRARTMNANAFANVTKRSILGIFFTYYASVNAFNQDVISAFSDEKGDRPYTPGTPEFRFAQGMENNPANDMPEGQLFDIRSSSPYGDSSNTNSMLRLESIVANHSWRRLGFISTSDQQEIPHDFYPTEGDEPERYRTKKVRFIGIRVSSSPTHPADGGMVYKFESRSGAPLRKYAQELRQLTRYQAFLQGITPWWAFAEMTKRAASNGASVAVSWPPPPGAAAGGALAGAVGAPPATVIDWRPRRPDGTTSVGLASNVRANGVAMNSSSDVLNACRPLARRSVESRSAGLNVGAHLVGSSGWRQEMNHNVQTLAERSGAAGLSVWAGAVGDPDFGLGSARNPGNRVPFAPGRGSVGGYSLCILALSGNGYVASVWRRGNKIVRPDPAPLDPEYAAPFLVQSGESPEMDDLRRSIFVFAGREPRGWGRGAERLDVMAGDYTASGMNEAARLESLYTMARSEIVALNVEGLEPGAAKGNWHANWGARMRPIFVDDESAVIANTLGTGSARGVLQAALAQAAGLIEASAALSGAGTPQDLGSDLSSVGRALGAYDQGVSAGVVK